MENIEPIEIGFNQEKKTVEEMREELSETLGKIENEESSSGGKMASKDLDIPDQVIRGVIRLENAVILSAVTKNASASVKEAAREALEPTDDDLKVVGNFINEVVKKYAPRAFQDPFMTALGLYGAHLAVKVGTVKALVEGGR